MSVRQRAAHQVTKLLDRLVSDQPARVHPRPGRTLDRRARLEAALRAPMLILRRDRLRSLAKAAVALTPLRSPSRDPAGASKSKATTGFSFLRRKTLIPRR
jgi:hypothetical protein